MKHLNFIKSILVISVSLALSSAGSAQVSEDIVEEVLQQMVQNSELNPSDIVGYRMTDHYMSKKGQIDHMYFCQMLNDIDVHNAIGAIHVLPNNKIVSKSINFVRGLSGKVVGKGGNLMGPIDAVTYAAEFKNYTLTEKLEVIGGKGGASQHTIISKGGISLDDIIVVQKYFPKGGDVYLTWEVSIYELGAQNYWVLYVDADTGEVMGTFNRVNECFTFDHSASDGESSSDKKENSFKSNKKAKYDVDSPKKTNSVIAPDSYNVYAIPVESPNFGNRSIVVNPADPTASAFGWHDTDGSPGAEFTTTQGNNVHAYTDALNTNTPDPGSSPDGGMSLDFNFMLDTMMAPSTYADASVTNLFYINNVIHDVTYLYGFDEDAGNFQVNNYGNGGLGNDAVRAEAHDGSGSCNANFLTPPDGSPPRMQMYTCNFIAPNRDGSLDNGVILHEYGHGISNRLLGGPSAFCLGSAEQMGEGWSDFFTLIFQLKPGDVGTNPKTVGTWLLAQGPSEGGVRATPDRFGVDGSGYSTDINSNTETYDSIKNSVRLPGVHGIGYVWAEMLWEMTWGLIDQYGLDADIYHGTGGNNIALQLVIEGMKMTACDPGFVDARNGILAADEALYGGANSCIIWQAFAKRGLGFSASQGSSSSRFDGTESFDVPPLCAFLIDTLMTGCDPVSVEYEIVVGELFDPGSTDLITLSVSGLPLGANATFSTNPVVLNGTSTMTITTSGVSAGEYMLTVTGTNTTTTEDIFTRLLVYTDVPGPVELMAPLNYDVILYAPTLRWRSSEDVQEFRLIISENSNLFAPIVDIVTTDTSFLFAGTLPETTYYWSVIGINDCGEATMRNIWRFTTLNTSCSATASLEDTILISETGTPIIMSTIELTSEGSIIDINVLNIDISHTWISDIQLAIQSPLGTIVELHDNNCFSQDNMFMGFDDQAPTNVYPCPPTGNINYIPDEPLSAFIGESIMGTWTLIVRDIANLDGGSLNGWSIEYCISDPLTCYLDVDGDGYGNPDLSEEPTGLCGFGYVLNGLDCNDDDQNIFPGQNCKVQEIPTLSEWGIILLSLLLVVFGVVLLRQRATQFIKL